MTWRRAGRADGKEDGIRAAHRLGPAPRSIAPARSALRGAPATFLPRRGRRARARAPARLRGDAGACAAPRRTARHQAAATRAAPWTRARAQRAAASHAAGAPSTRAGDAASTGAGEGVTRILCFFFSIFCLFVIAFRHLFSSISRHPSYYVLPSSYSPAARRVRAPRLRGISISLYRGARYRTTPWPATAFPIERAATTARLFLALLQRSPCCCTSIFKLFQRRARRLEPAKNTPSARAAGVYARRGSSAPRRSSRLGRIRNDERTRRNGMRHGGGGSTRQVAARLQPCLGNSSYHLLPIYDHASSCVYISAGHSIYISAPAPSPPRPAMTCARRTRAPPPALRARSACTCRAAAARRAAPAAPAQRRGRRPAAAP